MLEPTTPTADIVIADVLDQFARNFLLNDLESEQSGNCSKPRAVSRCSNCRAERPVDARPPSVRSIKRA